MGNGIDSLLFLPLRFSNLLPTGSAKGGFKLIGKGRKIPTELSKMTKTMTMRSRRVKSKTINLKCHCYYNSKTSLCCNDAMQDDWYTI